MARVDTSIRHQSRLLIPPSRGRPVAEALDMMVGDLSRKPEMDGMARCFMALQARAASEEDGSRGRCSTSLQG